MGKNEREFEELWRLIEQERPGVAETSTQKQEGRRNAANRPMSQKSVPFRKRRAAGQRRRRIIIGIAVLAWILLILIIAVICKSCSGNRGDLAALQGVWRYNQHTEYEFDGKGNGCMCVEGTNHYVFTYIIDGDTLKIDYALEYVTDCEYDFALENNVLTLIGGKGTANPGQEYTLVRVP